MNSQQQPSQPLKNVFAIQLSGKAVNLIQSVIVQTYDEAVKCLNTNYYGLKWITEALLPLLKQSPSGARIVNTTSLRSELKVQILSIKKKGTSVLQLAYLTT
jgi:NAD(P)-dependent dehydrogenase (short-subunit alcohol dehydrogenase family)